MRQTIVAAATALALAACPEVATGPQGPEGPQGPAGYSALQSGTRIKARVGTTPDGAKLFLGWFDNDRQENCSFRTAADGKVRCLPDAYDRTKVTMFTSPGRKFFADAACTVPAIPASDCMRAGTCAVPSTALEASEVLVTTNGDLPAYGVFEVAGLVTGGPVFELKNSGCSGWDFGYLTIAREIPSGDFAGIDETIE